MIVWANLPDFRDFAGSTGQSFADNLLSDWLVPGLSHIGLDTGFTKL